ncbi:MAG: hypothetical protein J2P56_11680 [Verrucomicrobia bacterium]|nr:hypothetical protein [Verrucomicrobiota bacterium]
MQSLLASRGIITRRILIEFGIRPEIIELGPVCGLLADEPGVRARLIPQQGI